MPHRHVDVGVWERQRAVVAFMQSGMESMAGDGAGGRGEGSRAAGAGQGGEHEGLESIGLNGIGPEKTGQAFHELEQAGARVLVHREAPDPGSHASALSEAAIARVLSRKVEERERRIESLRHEIAKGGVPADRIIAAIVYDTERAPRTTNRRQLVEIGIDAPASADGLTAAEVRLRLWTVIYGLARLGIFLLGTDHLDDRALLSRLCERILDDEVSDVPPTPDMSEFIDLGEGAFETARDQLGEICRRASGADAECPDGLLGPYESADSAALVDEDDDPSELAIGRDAGRSPIPASAGRDARLPRPARALWPETS